VRTSGHPRATEPDKRRRGDFNSLGFEPSGREIAQKAMECFTHSETAMLAEIFFLRLETMLRASEESDRAKNYRFVPLFDNVVPTFREEQARVGNRSVNG
jgi:hypothetical protein